MEYVQDTITLQQERNQIFKNFYNNIIPKRMPVMMTLPSHVMAEMVNVNSVEFQFDYALLRDAAETLCSSVYSDSCPVMPINISSRLPGMYQALDSQSFKMGGNGYMQHPEVVGMVEEDYKYLIEDPYACILERILPRQFANLSTDDSIMHSNAIAKAKAEISKQSGALMPIVLNLISKNGYYQGAPQGSVGFTAAPYDFLGDQLRSFSGISKDIRRNRNLIIDACEALFPLMFRLGLVSNPSPEGFISTPLHMPTFMREKDFVEVWLPTYKRMLEQYAALGMRVSAFCEHDWMRYLDILEELPAGTLLRFEYGDPKIIKQKLGKKFFIAGLYPIELIKRGTREECIDKAKELLDIMLPGGGYLFGFDKGPLMLSDINMDNYLALSEFLHEYAVYDNTGDSFGMKLNSEGFIYDPGSTQFESKYLTNWADYKDKYPMTPNSVRKTLEQHDNDLLRFYLNLLV
ncbi:MAG: hypothetical protein ACOWWR_03450 [Eubacteriales bacterium]